MTLSKTQLLVAGGAVLLLADLGLGFNQYALNRKLTNLAPTPTVTKEVMVTVVPTVSPTATPSGVLKLKSVISPKVTVLPTK